MSTNGCMFNIRAKDKTITLESLEVNIEPSSSQLFTFHVFERDGGHIGYEQSPNDWITTGVVRVKSSNSGVTASGNSTNPKNADDSSDIAIIPLDMFDSPVTIEAGEVKGLYLTTLASSAAILRSTLVRDKMVGEVASENDDLEIQVGTASNDSGADPQGGFGDFRQQRVINVKVVYEMHY